MKNFILGLIFGLVLSGGIAYASSQFKLVDGGGRDFGTETNPIYVQAI